MDTTEITWHLDPTCWQRARLGRAEALLWWEDDRVEWAVYAGGALESAERGCGPEEAARAAAEAALRKLA